MVRQVAHLEGKIEANKLLLSANSESLTKKESKMEELRKELEQQNEKQKQQFERERNEMLERLKQAEGLAHRYEKMPSWVKKMFGT